jgi:hypothetical protein
VALVDTTLTNLYVENAMATTKDQVLISAKARSITALRLELDKLEIEQLRLGRMSSYIIDSQTVLSAKCQGIQSALNKLLS